MCWSFLAIHATSVFAQTPGTFDVHGKLHLVDLPPNPTPVSAWLITLHPLTGGTDIQATPDSSGSFVLKGVKGKRYSIDLHALGRFVSFTAGPVEKNPTNFGLSPDQGELRIVVSLKTTQLTVNVAASDAAGNRVIVLCPADARMTQPNNCMTNPANGTSKTFQHITPGTYRVFLVDTAVAHDVAKYAPGHPDFLTKAGLPFPVLATGGTETAKYVDAEAVRAAVESQSSPR